MESRHHPRTSPDYSGNLFRQPRTQLTPAPFGTTPINLVLLTHTFGGKAYWLYTITMTSGTSTSSPDVFDQITIISLLSTLGILFAAISLSRQVLDSATPAHLRGLFIWHAFDALIHFTIEGGFLYHCFFSSLSLAELQTNGDVAKYYPDPPNYLGQTDRVHGSQAGGGNPFAQLWMVYARADRRWAGVDLVRCSTDIRRFQGRKEARATRVTKVPCGV